MMRALFTLAALAVAALGWWLAGWAADAAGFGALAWPASAAGAFAALALAEQLQNRVLHP